MPLNDEELAKTWIEEHRDYKKGIGPGYRELNTLCESEPKRALAIIADICCRDTSDPIAEILAAGPLENLLVRHGESIINDVIALAKANEQFKNLLGGVWKNAMSDALWAKLRQVGGDYW